MIVGASGAIWLIDGLLFASARSARLAELQKQYPRWNETDSADNKLFIESASREAADPVLVEYAKSFFPVLAFVLVLRSFLYEPFQIPHRRWCRRFRSVITFGEQVSIQAPSSCYRTKVWDVSSPKRGDVMVFYPPANDQYYIKRVIGVPGIVFNIKTSN